MSKLTDSKIKKYIPENIISTLSYVDFETFPYNLPLISTKEMLRILAVFMRTGKTFSQIKNGLVDIADGKSNELSNFVSTYPRNNNNNVEYTLTLENSIRSIRNSLVPFEW